MNHHHNITILFIILLIAGCNAPDTQKDSAESHIVLNKMLETYRYAHSYADHAEFVLQGSDSDVRIRCTVAYIAPNKLRIELADGYLTCDGEVLYAQAPPFPNQVVEQPSPEKIDLPTLLGDTWLALMFGFVEENVEAENGLAWLPPQLLLLFGGESTKSFLPIDSELKLLERDNIKNDSCERLSIEIPKVGNIVYWIRSNDNTLLRVDYPASPQSPKKFWRLEITDAIINGEITNEAFQMVEPEGSHHVKAITPFPENAPLQQTPDERNLIEQQEKLLRKVLDRSLNDGKYRMVKVWD
jgi:outer membrane lipoprotein-sorting protein